MNQKQAHWFPGHMVKALRAIEEKLAWIDAVVIALDARAIQATMALPLTIKKPIVYVITKSDLVQHKHVTNQVNHLRQLGHRIVISEGKTKRSRHLILKALHEVGQPIWTKQTQKGVKPQPLKIMILGVPNVGKSTLINLLAMRQRVLTENRPGTTRGQQWIKLDDKILLLDTPGILPPRYDQPEIGVRLGLIGAIPISQLPLDSLMMTLYHILEHHYPDILISWHGNKPQSALDFYEKLGAHRGWTSQGKVDLDRVYTFLIQAFQKGKLGAISLEHLPDENQS